MVIKFNQGDNYPKILLDAGQDMTNLAGACRVSAYIVGKIVASGLAADVTMKIDDQTADRLRKYSLPAGGVRAYLPATREWVVITAISGRLLTITRAAVDPGAVATVAADFNGNTAINLFLIDGAPDSCETVTVPTPDVNKVEIRLTVAQASSIPGLYAAQFAFSDAGAIFTLPQPGDEAIQIEIVEDPNKFGVS